MFPATDGDWIEESLEQNKKNDLINLNNISIIEVNKLYYHVDSEDIAFRIKINCLITKDTTKIPENTTWGININDSDSKKLLFSLQLNDTNDKCTIELLDQNKTTRTSLEGKTSVPAEKEDNIKITTLSSEAIDTINMDQSNLICFNIDFKFPNNLIYKHLPTLINKELNCYLTYYILESRK
ncbi:hypothetical protein [Clostridium sp.]|uniref:hypothetical protein n=1 Tax=Clostridium sp. TaxID=1506 RepID=UPI002FC9C9FC